MYVYFNNVSHKTAHKELTDLAEKGILKREGGGRSMKYLIKVG